METNELMKKAKNGDKEALLKLVMTQQAEYYKLAYVYMKNKEDALDALQDMIIILYDNISKLKYDDAFYSWSKTILVNSCKNKLKRNKRVISIEDIGEQSMDKIYNEPDNKIVLDKYISKLSAKHQEVIKLRYYLDLDYENISRVLNVPLGTVKSRLNAGLRKLREALGGEFIE